MTIQPQRGIRLAALIFCCVVLAGCVEQFVKYPALRGGIAFVSLLPLAGLAFVLFKPDGKGQ